MTNYTKGVRLEREIIKIFEQNGYKALRTAGSHGVFDVILYKQTEENKKVCFVAFVQCKVNKLRSSTKKGQQEKQEESPEQLLKLVEKS